MGRMEEYHILPPGVRRGWWGTTWGKLIRTPITLWRPLQFAREGPSVTVTETTQGYAELPSKVEPQTQTQPPVAPTPRLEIVVFQMGVPIPMYFGSQYVH